MSIIVLLDCIKLIGLYLSTKDLFHLFSTCKRLYPLLDDRDFWKQRYLHDYPLTTKFENYKSEYLKITCRTLWCKAKRILDENGYNEKTRIAFQQYNRLSNSLSSFKTFRYVAITSKETRKGYWPVIESYLRDTSTDNVVLIYDYSDELISSAIVQTNCKHLVAKGYPGNQLLCYYNLGSEITYSEFRERHRIEGIFDY